MSPFVQDKQFYTHRAGNRPECKKHDYQSFSGAASLAVLLLYAVTISITPSNCKYNTAKYNKPALKGTMRKVRNLMTK